jgi:uncharacterized protein YjdB
MFLPDGVDYERSRPAGWANNKFVSEEDEDRSGAVFADYVPPAIRVTSPFGSAATVVVDRSDEYFSRNIILEVTVTASRVREANGSLRDTEATIPDPDPEKRILYTRTSHAVIHVHDIGVDEIRLNHATQTMRAGASVTLRASLFKDGAAAPARTVTWNVVREYDSAFPELRVNVNGTDYTRFNPYDPRDPYAPGGPIAVVNKEGRVTALSDGRAFVYAEVTVGSQTFQSDPCRVTIQRTAANRVTLNRRRHTMSVGTQISLTPSVRPANASNRGVSWTAGPDSNGILEIDQYGLITAIGPGRATVIATIRENSLDDEGNPILTNITAECVITVEAGPSNTVRINRRGNFNVLGSNSRSDVEWKLIPGEVVVDEHGRVDFDADKNVATRLRAGASESPFDGFLSSTVRNRLTATHPGPALLIGTIYVTADEPVMIDGKPETRIPVRTQSWRLESAIPISRMAIRRAGEEEVIRNIILGVGVDENNNPVNGQEVPLNVIVQRPDDATLLDFDWTVRTRRGQEDKPIVCFGFDAENDNAPLTHVTTSGENRRNITITALRPGSTRITGTNHNGNRRVTLSVRVFLYPEANQIRTRSQSITIDVGRAANARAKVNGKNLHRSLTYSLVTGGENPDTRTALPESNPFVMIDARQRLTGLQATEEGTGIWLRVTGAGPEGPGTGNFVDIPITVRERQTRR